MEDKTNGRQVCEDMESKLIIIRGNAGSRKTTKAERLQKHWGNGTLLVYQDVVRREMLKVKDRDGNLSIVLIRQIAEYGKNRCEYFIVEGILYKNCYGDMLNDFIQFYNQRAYPYYYDLSFEETVKRHNSRSKKTEFGEDSLRAWWNPNDYLGAAGETRMTSQLSQNDVLKLILNQFQE